MSMPPPGQPGSTQTGDERARIGAGAVASGIGIAALVVFLLQNTDDVQVSFLSWDFSWPVWLLILVSAALGALIWIGFGIMRRHRRRKERRADRRG